MLHEDLDACSTTGHGSCCFSLKNEKACIILNLRMMDAFMQKYWQDSSVNGRSGLMLLISVFNVHVYTVCTGCVLLLVLPTSCGGNNMYSRQEVIKIRVCSEGSVSS